MYRKIWLIISLLVFLLIVVIMIFSSKIVTYSKEIDAKVYVVEGWMPEYNFDFLYSILGDKNDILIFTSGIELSDFFCMHYNGFLVFNLINEDIDSIDDLYDISIITKGEIINGDSTQMNLWINDSLVFKFRISEEITNISYKIQTNQIDSIAIEYSNDQLNKRKDMNLSVKEITINGKRFQAYSRSNYYDRYAWDGILSEDTGYRSYAEYAESYLERIGFDPARVISISGYGKRNRTYRSARAVKEYLIESYPGIEKFNLVTTENHSRRTYITYKYLFGKNVEIGVIALEDDEYSGFVDSKIDEIRELLAIIYYRILFVVNRFLE